MLVLLELDFQGGNTTGNATFLLLKEFESMTTIVPKLADCTTDSCRSSLVPHIIIPKFNDIEDIVEGKQRLALFNGAHQESSYQLHHP